MITMTTLGTNGRLGNQLFQYAFLRSYANAYGYTYATPRDWIGRKWFPKTTNDPVITNVFSRKNEIDFEFGLDNIDLKGYYQNQTSLNFLHKQTVKSWYEFSDEILEKFKKPRDFYIAVHIRRGDYVHHPIYPTITKQCYIDRIIENGFNPKDIVWVEEGKKTEGDLGLIGDPLYDFLTIQNADVVFRCNSTFSWWAAAINEKSQIYSPVVVNHLYTKNADVPFVFGNYPTPTVWDEYHTDLHWG